MASDIYSQSAFLVRKAAYLYYELDMSQQEIAALLKISVTTVSRLIKKAKDEKLVRYVMDNDCIKCIRMSERLRLKYHLKDVIMAPIPNRHESRDNVDKRKLVALEGARYLQRNIKENDVLGISWGRIVCDMLLYLNPSRKSNTKFVTLHGQLGPCITQELDDLVRGMAKTFSGSNYCISSRALEDTKEQAEAVKKEPLVREVYDMFDSVNISIVGIGTWYPDICSILANDDFMSRRDQEELIRKGAVGDVGLRFFDQEGQECGTSLSQRLVAIGLEQYKNIDHKIVVAAGNEKAETLRSALRGGMVDVLITDEELGEKLLEIE